MGNCNKRQDEFCMFNAFLAIYARGHQQVSIDIGMYVAFLVSMARIMKVTGGCEPVQSTHRSVWLTLAQSANRMHIINFEIYETYSILSPCQASAPEAF